MVASDNNATEAFRIRVLLVGAGANGHPECQAGHFGRAVSNKRRAFVEQCAQRGRARLIANNKAVAVDGGREGNLYKL